MRVPRISVRPAVQRATGPAVRFRVPSSGQYKRDGRYHADHEDDASDADSDREVALGYADLVVSLRSKIMYVKK